MLKNKQWIALVVLLALFTTLAAPPASEAAGKLTDLREAVWAEQAITEMHASGIITGYPNATFKPYNNVTRLEALAMLIRVLGKDEQAKALDKAKVDYKLPSNLYWGRGYLIMGVQMGMLNKDYLYLLQPNEPASRVEVTVLAYHALKLKPDSSELTFADTGQIPQEYRECVAAVVKNKIMQGLPGNVFKPNDNINRAQMAVLISRLVDNKFANPYPDHLYAGKLALLDKAGRVLTVQLENGVSLSKVFTAGCEVFLDGKRVEAGALKAGDTVRLILDKSGQVVFIKAERVETTGQKYQGRVDNLFKIGEDTWVAFTDFSGAKITRSAAGNVNTENLKVGSYVEVEVADNKFTKINLLATTTVKGTVTSVSQSRLTLRESGGTSRDYNVPGDVVVVMNNNRMTYEAVKKNDQVEATVYDNRVIHLNILLSGHLEGEIVELDTTGTYGITIKNDDGDEKDYVVLSTVEVEKDGDEIDFEDLREGDRVRLELDSRDRVIAIEVTGSANPEGEIVELDTTGTYGITIKNDDGDEEDYVVLSGVEVEKNGSEIDFEDLREGDRVSLELNSRDRVVRIKVLAEDSSTKTGKVTELTSDSSNPLIRIENSTGRKLQYYISSRATYIRDGQSISLTDIVIGCEVELRLESGKVKRIKVTNDEDITVAGEVTYVSTSRERVTIEQLNGNKFSYYLAGNAILKDRNGRTIVLDDVEEDWEVELVLKDGKISKLTRL